MADKRTAELQTMDVTVAYFQGLLVVDSLTLQSVDGEQQKVLIYTLLERFRQQGEDFYIGNLQLDRTVTTNDNYGDVLISDPSGNIYVRNIGDLVAGTELIESEFIRITNPLTESPEGDAEDQATLNEQVNNALSNLEDSINAITNLGAALTVVADPVPVATTTTEATIPFSTLFASTNENVIEADDTDNEIDLKANGTYQLAAFFKISNADASTTHTLTIRARDVDTDDIIFEEDLIVYNDGFTGTLVDRFAITAAPQSIYLTAESSDASDLAIESAQINIISLATGVTDAMNPYIVELFGQDDGALDIAHLQDHLSALTENQILKLYGTFELTDQIDFEDLENNVIDCSAAFLKFYRTDANPVCFNVVDCQNLKFLNLTGSFEHATSTDYASIFNLQASTGITDNLIFENFSVPIVGGTVTTEYRLFYGGADATNVRIKNVLGDYGYIYLYTKAIIENVFLTDSSALIEVVENGKILKCNVYTITVTADNENIVTNNYATVYNGNSGTNIFNNNIGLSYSGGLQPSDDAQITGNWYFDNNVGFGGVSAPSEAIEVAGNILLNTAAPYVDLYNTSGGVDAKYFRIINNSAKLIFRSLTDAGATIDNILTLKAADGFVGINESSPTYQLHVDGDSYFIGNMIMQDGFLTINSSLGGIVLNDGSGSDVEIKTNTNGGLYINVASGKIFNFAVNTASKIYINDSGNVGINTASPTYQLHVNGTGYFSTQLNIDAFIISSTELLFSTSSRINIYQNTTSSNSTNYIVWDGKFFYGSATAHVFRTNGGVVGIGTNRVAITDDGLGIGTDGPTEKLEVIGNIKNTTFKIRNSSGNTILENILTGDVYIRPGGAGKNIYIADNFADAFVGIGTVSPTEKLEVIGNILLNNSAVRIDLLNTSGSTNQKIFRFVNSSGKLYISSLLDDFDYNYDIITLTYSGYVGINNDTPSYSLDVSGSSRLNGNVGINTAPLGSYSLYVLYDAWIDGDLIVNTHCTIEGNLTVNGTINNSAVVAYAANVNSSGIAQYNTGFEGSDWTITANTSPYSYDITYASAGNVIATVTPQSDELTSKIENITNGVRITFFDNTGTEVQTAFNVVLLDIA